VIAFVHISCSIASVLLILFFVRAFSQDLDGLLADANGFSFALDKVGNLGKGKGLGKDKGLGKGKGKPLALKDRENQEDGEAQPDEAALLEDAFAKARKCRSLVLVSSATFEDALLQMKNEVLVAKSSVRGPGVFGRVEAAGRRLEKDSGQGQCDFGTDQRGAGNSCCAGEKVCGPNKGA